MEFWSGPDVGEETGRSPALCLQKVRAEGHQPFEDWSSRQGPGSGVCGPQSPQQILLTGGWGRGITVLWVESQDQKGEKICPKSWNKWASELGHSNLTSTPAMEGPAQPSATSVQKGSEKVGGASESSIQKPDRSPPGCLPMGSGLWVGKAEVEDHLGLTVRWIDGWVDGWMAGWMKEERNIGSRIGGMEGSLPPSVELLFIPGICKVFYLLSHLILGKTL